jgi:hypothetical protein
MRAQCCKDCKMGHTKKTSAAHDRNQELLRVNKYGLTLMKPQQTNRFAWINPTSTSRDQ